VAEVGEVDQGVQDQSDFLEEVEPLRCEVVELGLDAEDKKN